MKFFSTKGYIKNMKINKILSVLALIIIIPSTSFSSDKKYDVVAIGKAMVDLIEYTSDAELLKIIYSPFEIKIKNLSEYLKEYLTLALVERNCLVQPNDRDGILARRSAIER